MKQRTRVNGKWNDDRRKITYAYACLMYVWGGVPWGELDPLTATLPLIWAAGRGESRERFDDFDGLVRAADWLPPTSRRTFDEIQTFGPIPSASCGNRGPRNGVVYFATLRGCARGFWKTSVRSARSESSTIDAPVDPISGPRAFTREANRPAANRSNTIGFRDRGSLWPTRPNLYSWFAQRNF